MSKINLLVVSLLIVLGGCSGLPEGRTALSPPGSEAYDQRILGSWLSTKGSQRKYEFHLKARSEPNMLDGFAISMSLRDSNYSQSNSPEIEWFTSVIHATKLDGSTYYNLKRLPGIGSDYGAAKGKSGYILIKADLENDHTLNMCVMNHSAVGQAIKKGAIKGVHVKRDDSKNVKLDYYYMDASKAEMIKFIRNSKKDDLFGDCLKFNKFTTASKSGNK
jgi:hypothetical protein